VILKVFADGGVAQHVDAHGLQERARPYARKLQDLRAADRAGGRVARF